MKAISRVPCTLGVCATAAILAACGGSAQLSNSTALVPFANSHTVVRPASPSDIIPSAYVGASSNIERLIGMAKRNKCKMLGEEETCHFVAFGKRIARGLYPGTFTAKGTWTSEMTSIPRCPAGCWTFSESFTITSGATRIVGSISASGKGETFIPIPGIYQYTTKNGYSGNVKISGLVRRFRETFYGM